MTRTRSQRSKLDPRFPVSVRTARRAHSPHSPRSLHSPRNGLRIVFGAIACALALAGTGCVPPIWSPISEPSTAFAMTTIQIKARLPAGWMSSTYEPLGGVWHFSRHGDELDQIYLRRWPRTTVVKGTNRTIRDGMSIQEIASLSLDSRRLDEGVGSLEVVSNRPTKVAERDCYRLDYRYRNAIGLPKRTVEYGCPVGTWMYRFEFNAPSQHYFDRHLGAFEAMVETIVFEVPGA